MTTHDFTTATVRFAGQPFTTFAPNTDAAKAWVLENFPSEDGNETGNMTCGDEYLDEALALLSEAGFTTDRAPA